jgi:hypothetical protein
MARQKLGLQWQAKGEEQKKSEQPIQAQAWATRSIPGEVATPQVGRPRVIDQETTERLQVRIDRELVETLRLQASREKLSISQLMEKVVREWKLNK